MEAETLLYANVATGGFDAISQICGVGLDKIALVIYERSESPGPEDQDSTVPRQPSEGSEVLVSGWGASPVNRGVTSAKLLPHVTLRRLVLPMPGIRTAVGERGTNDVTAGRVDGELATVGAVIQRRNAWQQQGSSVWGSHLSIKPVCS
ncbi:unnamed protein product [Arctogadus glacialis]